MSKCVQVLRVDPPYEIAIPAEQVEAVSSKAAVLLIQPDVGVEPVVIKRMAETITRHHPDASVVVRFRIDDIAMFTTAVQLRASGVCVIIEDGSRLEAQLRKGLCDQCLLTADLREWLRCTLPDLGARNIGWICDVAIEPAAASRAVRQRFERLRIPPPSQWKRAVRNLERVLWLQQHERVNCAAAAIELGFADHQAMCRTFKQCFATRPTEIRRLLGWRWVMHNWVQDRVGRNWRIASEFAQDVSAAD